MFIWFGQFAEDEKTALLVKGGLQEADVLRARNRHDEAAPAAEAEGGPPRRRQALEEDEGALCLAPAGWNGVGADHQDATLGVDHRPRVWVGARRHLQADRPVLAKARVGLALCSHPTHDLGPGAPALQDRPAVQGKGNEFELAEILPAAGAVARQGRSLPAEADDRRSFGTSPAQGPAHQRLIVAGQTEGDNRVTGEVGESRAKPIAFTEFRIGKPRRREPNDGAGTPADEGMAGARRLSLRSPYSEKRTIRRVDGASGDPGSRCAQFLQLF